MFLNIVVLLITLWRFTSSTTVNLEEIISEAKNLQFISGGLESHKDIELSSNNPCVVTLTNNCNFYSLPFSDTTSLNFIQPGGKTSCLDTKAPFVFSVEKGSTSDVLIYFQGGGVCVDQASYNSFACNTNVTLGTREGILDRKDPNNIYRFYTTVEVFYCSGDFFIGDKQTTFKNWQGLPAYYRGQSNALSVINWIAQQQQYGFLAKTLNNLLIAGSSAGGAGSAFWTTFIASKIPAKSTAVIIDSFFNYLPTVPNTPGVSYEFALFGLFGTCTSTVYRLPIPLLQQCATFSLTSANIMSYNFKSNPTIAFYGIESKFDAYSIGVHNALAVGFNISGPNGVYKFPYTQFWTDLYTNLFLPFNAIPNFLLFAVDGTAHTYINSKYLYTTTNLGCGSAGNVKNFCNPLQTGNGPFSLYSQIQNLPLSTFHPIARQVCVNPQVNIAPCGVLANNKTYGTPSSKKICQYGGYCRQSADCVLGNKCSLQNQYYSQCLPDPTTYLSKQCISNWGSKCTSTSQCCDPGATCSGSGYMQCYQPMGVSGLCANPNGYN